MIGGGEPVHGSGGSVAGQPPDEGGRGWVYRPALDGVRAAAVAAVLVFHARPDWLRGGFLGVDAFFVLSGFLITGLLLAEHQRTGRIRLVPFWLRRARRLLPALLLVLVATIGIGRLTLADTELAALRQDAFAALGYVANWRMIYRGGGYFADTGAASLLQHTWSLGIEEQFYLAWPLLVLLALRASRPGLAVLVVSLTGVVASTIVSVLLYQPGVDPSRVYYGTDARAGALLTGCALAALLSGLTTWRNERASRAVALAAVPAVAVLGWAWWRTDGGDGWLYQGGFTGLAVAVAVVLGYLVLVPAGWGARLLSVPPVVWLGRISYGVYLWHWPLYGLLNADRTGLVGVPLTALRVAATIAVAAVSFYLVEQPIRRGRFGVGWSIARVAPRISYRTVVASGVAVALTATMTTVFVGTAVSPGPAMDAAAEAPPLAPAGEYAQPTARPAPNQAPTDRPNRRPGALPRITFLGDSVSWSVAAHLPEQPDLAIGNRTTPGCGIARLPDIMYGGGGHTNREDCDRWDEIWRPRVKLDDPDVAVILLDRWELMDRRLNGRYQHVGESEYNVYLAGELELAVSIGASYGARVVLLTAPYTRRLERPDGSLWPEDDPARVDAWNQLLHKVAARHPDQPTVLDLNRVVCPDGVFTWRIGNVRVRTDGLHFTEAGVEKFIAPWLLPQLAWLATNPPDTIRRPDPQYTKVSGW